MSSRKLITIAEVVLKCGGVSKSTIYRRVKAGQFPAPIHVFGDHGSSRWYADEIDSALDARGAERSQSRQ